MLTFDRSDFEKTISTSVKRKINYVKIWNTENLISLFDIADIRKGTSITKEKIIEGNIPVVAGGKEPVYFHNEANRDGNVITISASGAYSGYVNYFEQPIFASDCNTINSKDEKQISTKLIYEFLKLIQKEIYWLQRGQAQPHVYGEDIAKIKIPLPPLDIQQKIVSEIDALEQKEEKAKTEIERLREEIELILKISAKREYKLGDVVSLEYGISLPQQNRVKGGYPVVGSNGIVGFHNDYLVKAPVIVVGRKGSAGKVNWIDKNCTPIDTTFYVSLINDKFSMKILYYTIRNMNLENISGGTGVPGLNRNEAYSQSVFLPPLSEQEKIVSEIEKIEVEIVALENEIAGIPKQKEEVLRKLLN